MVTNPEGGGDEGVVCFGYPDSQRPSLAIRFGDEHATHRLRAVRFRFSDRPPVRPASGPARTPRCPRTSGRRSPARRRSHGSGRRPTPGRPRGTPCRTAHRTDSRATPSLWHVTPPGVSEPSVEVRRLIANLLALVPLRTSVLNSGPFPPPELPGFDGTTGLSATPVGPACPSRASGWRSRAATAWGFTCCAGFSVCRHAVATTPVGPPGSCRFTGVSLILPSGCGLPRYVGGSAPTSCLSGPARRSLALRPASSPNRQGGPFSRRLRRFRYLHRRSDSFRLERLS